MNRCPECRAIVDAEAVVCGECGLIVSRLSTPGRRKDDQERQARRAADQFRSECPWCHGTIDSRAVRCRHCSQIIDPEFQNERLRRRRAQINYASWVAYIFGLGAFLIFKPVGLISIAAGLLLSIIYYAIPVEVPMEGSEPKEPRLKRMGAFLKRQLRSEKVALPVPHFSRLRLVLVGTPIIAAFVGYGVNALLLQKPVDQILAGQESFAGMEVSAHYQYWVIPGVVVYDLREINVEESPLQAYAAFLEFARHLKDRDIDRVELQYRGTPKFTIEGATFRRIGEEYSRRNLQWLTFEFPRSVLTGRDGAPPAEDPSLMSFHEHWFVNDMKRDLGIETVAQSLVPVR